MADPRGAVILTADGKDFKLHLGMSVLADLQSKHGQDVLGKLDAPEGAGDDWMPDLNIVLDVFLGALQRYHADEADRYLVDDLMAENEGALETLLGGSTSEGEPAKPPGKKRTRKARS